MALDTDRQLAYELRDDLQAAFIGACDVVTLERIRQSGGRVIEIDLIGGTASLGSSVAPPELIRKVRDHLALSRVSHQAALELRVRADLNFSVQKRSCAIAGVRNSSAPSRDFVVCKIKGKSIVRVGKWHVWSADPWDEWIEWPVMPESLLVTGA